MIKQKNMNKESMEKVIRLLNSKHARKILEITSEKPLSANQISIMANIPRPKVYRWLRRMEELQLLYKTGEMTETHHKIRFFKNAVKMVIVSPSKSTSYLDVIVNGDNITCAKCSSGDYSIKYDKNLEMFTDYCKNCEINTDEFFIQKQKDSQQESIILQAIQDRHEMIEEKQKSLILEGILEKLC